jgi:hypothetical protein
MLKRFSVVMLVMLLVGGLGTTAQAQRRGNWILLGERHIDGRIDNDKIDIGKDRGTFRAIQFRVEGGTVNFDRITVRYLNGASEEIPVRAEIRSGSKSRPVDLPGERRVIESIAMWYGKGNWHTRPTVRVYGMR